MRKPHIGSSFESFLEEEGILEDCTAAAIKRIRARQAGQPEQGGSAVAASGENQPLDARDGDDASKAAKPAGTMEGIFANRQALANLPEFDRIMNRKGGEPPHPGDELPPDLGHLAPAS